MLEEKGSVNLGPMSGVLLHLARWSSLWLVKIVQNTMVFGHLVDSEKVLLSKKSLRMNLKKDERIG